MTTPYRFPLNYTLAALAAGLSLTAHHALAQTADSSAGLERVTITSEKRLTVLDKTPDAVSAISGSRLTEMGASGLQDVMGLVPNASFSSYVGTARINIRGVGLNTSIGDPGVSTYIDGTYVSDVYSTNTGMFDLQRIEVLRGPQGALYGRNATGGAVNYVTAKPTQDKQGRFNVLVGNYGQKETEGFVSGALGESSTSGRFSWQVKSRDGFTKNTIAGTSYSSVYPGYSATVGPDKLDDLKSHSFRLQTLTDLGEGGNVRLILGSHKENDVGLSYAVLPQDKLGSKYLYGVTPSADRFVNSSNGQSTLVEAKTAQAIYERPLGDNTLTATASYRKGNSVLISDIDGTPALVGSSDLRAESTEKSLDVHLASADGQRLQWLVGATYLDLDVKGDSQFQQQLSTGILLGNPALNAIPFPNNFMLGGTQTSRASALYADTRYALTPTLAVRAGMRVNKDTKDAYEYNSNSAILSGQARTARPSGSWNSSPGNIGLEWNMSPSTMVYGKLSQGFKSGAINLGLLQTKVVDPETVFTKEVGVKTSFMDNRGAFSAALFNSNYKDMQFSQITVQSQTLINAPGAKIDGLELEVLFKPASSLILGANLGLMDPKFTDFTNTNTRNMAAGPVSVNGNQITNVSKRQASLSADYTQIMGQYKTTLRADYVWRDKFYFTEFNDADTMQSAYGVLNLAASVRPVGSKWKVYAQIKNATDTMAYSNLITGGQPTAGQRTVTYIPPRTFGIGLSVDL